MTDKACILALLCIIVISFCAFVHGCLRDRDVMLTLQEMMEERKHE